MVTKNPKAYWPIGSDVDFQEFINLRTYADVIIHGKNTALWHRTVDSLAKKEFQRARIKRGKNSTLPYVVVSAHPNDELIPILENDTKQEIILATVDDSKISAQLQKYVTVKRFKGNIVDVTRLANFLHKKGYKTALIEGGPILLGHFFKQNLTDEIFLTIAPKVFGGEDNNTITMVENTLLLPHEIKHFELISSEIVENELFLRYKIK